MRRGGRVPNVIANTGIVRALAPAACVQKHPHASAPGCARTTSNACGSPTTIFRGTRTLRRRQASTAPLGTRHSPSHPVTRTRRHSRPAGRCSGGRLPPSLALVSRACWTSSTFDWVSGHVNTGRTKKKNGHLANTFLQPGPSVRPRRISHTHPASRGWAPRHVLLDADGPRDILLGGCSDRLRRRACPPCSARQQLHPSPAPLLAPLSSG